jgi:ornithine decarboxylase
LPRVEPFYAVKCNPEPALIKTLAELGAGFDCASLGEIMQVLSYGVAPERVIMANPCKPASHIVGARKAGVARMTFDNADELHKIARVFPEAELVLRILADDSHSVMRFGSKFGAPPSSWAGLMQLARSLGLNVVGVSFHVGSGCMSPLAFTAAVRRARAAFDVAAEHGFRLRLLDIGGGFPGNDPDPDTDTDTGLVNEAGEAGAGAGAGAGPGSVDAHSQAPEFEAVARALGPELEALFPAEEVRVIGEPGRFFAASTHTLAVSVCSRRVLAADGPREVPHADDLRFLYYINDGVYGSFNCIFFDHAQPQPRVLSAAVSDPSASSASGSTLHRSKIFGPTCDSLDVVCAAAMLPELQVGDWLYFRNMGAYTTASSSRFNGFRTTQFFYVETTTLPRLTASAPLKLD